jgi:hypothetical protein
VSNDLRQSESRKFSRSRHWIFWSDDKSLTSLLIVTLISLFFSCALSDFSVADLISDALFSLIIVTGVLATFRQRWVRYFSIVLAVASLTITWKQHIHLVASLIIPDLILKSVFLGLLLAVLFVQVFRAGPVTAHRIRGAIVIYLLLGVMWCFFYHFAQVITPRAFHFPPGVAIHDPYSLERILTYFSFTTLTTTGFGDVAPAAPLTRTLALFEALVGQFYIAITLARLVSLTIAQAGGSDKSD